VIVLTAACEAGAADGLRAISGYAPAKVGAPHGTNCAAAAPASALEHAARDPPSRGDTLEHRVAGQAVYRRRGELVQQR